MTGAIRSRRTNPAPEHTTSGARIPTKRAPKVFSGALIFLGIMKLLLASRGENAIVYCSPEGDLPPYNVS